MKELGESRDKFIHQDQAAKSALQQMQKETAYRLEQVKLGPAYPSSLTRICMYGNLL